MRKSDFRDCDIYAAQIARLRPLPKETLKSLRDYYRVGLTYTSNALEGLMGESVALDNEGVKGKNDEGVNEGVKTLLEIIRANPGKRANELATLIGKSVQTAERYVRSLKEADKIEFRGAPKNGGYFTCGS